MANELRKEDIKGTLEHFRANLNNTVSSLEKSGAPSIRQLHNANTHDPLVYAAYYRTTVEGSIEGEPFSEQLFVVGYVLAIDGPTAWVRAYSEQVPNGEEGSENLAALSPVYVPQDGLDWDVPLIGGLNTGVPFRVSLVQPPLPLSHVTRGIFHTGGAGSVSHPAYRGFESYGPDDEE